MFEHVIIYLDCGWWVLPSMIYMV